MSTPHQPRRRPSLSAARLLATAGLASACLAGAASAQVLPAESPQGNAQAGRQPTAVHGRLSLSASRAWVWADGDEAGAGLGNETGPGPGAVQRLALVGDVIVKLGAYEFNAARAVAWIERLDDSPLPPMAAGTPRAGVFRVFLYFDRVGNPSGPAGVSLSADRLPVRAVIDVDDAVLLKFDSVKPGRPADDFVTEAERARDLSIRREAGDPGAEVEEPAFKPPYSAVDAKVDPSTARPYRAGRDLDLGGTAEAFERAASRLPYGEENSPIFAKDGVFTLSAGQLTYVGKPEGGEPGGGASVIATGGVIVQYNETRADHALGFQAQRVVVFLAGEGDENIAQSASGRFGVTKVAGIYLEGDVVASDGKFTLRGPRMYYDVQRNRAVVLDAVFWSYDERRGLPLYVRADVIRQESLQQFTAEHAVFSTSAFFVPELAIGAQSVTIRRQTVEMTAGEIAGVDGGGGVGRSGLTLPGSAGDDLGIVGGGPGGLVTRDRTLVEASHVTLRARGLPFFYLPEFSGDPNDVAIKDVRFETRRGSGTAIKTRWNLPSLLGLERVDRTQIDLLLQDFLDRGYGVGLDTAWQREGSYGKLFAYSLIDDRGEDLFKPGTKVVREKTTRGLLLGEQNWELSEHWRLFAEGAYIGDEGVLDTFFDTWGATNRQFSTGVTLLRKVDNMGFYARATGNANDFIANEWLVQSRGYTVSKAPEIGYVRQSDLLLEDSFLGPVYWTQDWQYSHMKMRFDNIMARERGFIDTFLAQRGFGIGPNDRISDFLRTQGYTGEWVHRLDTRHEFSTRYDLDPVNIEPFAIARVTAYDNDFPTFSPASTDPNRVWGAIGARAGTTIQHIDDSVDSRLWDLHRIRHVIEPSVTVMQSGTNIHRVELPVYDEGVESLAEGGMIRFGADQTWQTERGARPGKWHNVDVFKLRTDVVLSSRDTDRKSEYGRWIDYRPELSNPGKYFIGEGQWQVSSAVALTGSSIYNFDTNQQDRASGGILIQHSPRFSSLAELRYLNPVDSTYLDLGANYLLTQKYAVGIGASYDVANGGFQGANGDVRRYFDAFEAGVRLSYNSIANVTGFGFVIKPTPVARKQRTAILNDESPPGDSVTPAGRSTTDPSGGMWR
ncbi:MAG: hypothetical protein AABZ53_10650 [Planctomycetota bacterium]